MINPVKGIINPAKELIKPLKGLVLSSLITTGLVSSVFGSSPIDSSQSHLTKADYQLTSSTVADIQPVDLGFAAVHDSPPASIAFGAYLFDAIDSLWMATLGTPVDFIRGEIAASSWNTGAETYAQDAADAAHAALNNDNPTDLDYYTYYSAASAIDEMMSSAESNYSTDLFVSYLDNWPNIFINLLDALGPFDTLFGIDIPTLDVSSLPDTFTDLTIHYPGIGTPYSVTNANIPVDYLTQHGPDWAGSWSDHPAGPPSMPFNDAQLPTSAWTPDNPLVIAAGLQHIVDNLGTDITNTLHDTTNALSNISQDAGTDLSGAAHDVADDATGIFHSLLHDIGLSADPFDTADIDFTGFDL